VTDRELLAAFEDTTLAHLSHRDHVRLGWLYLADPLAVAAPRFITALRRYAEAKGAGEKYHETITWAFLLLIADRRSAGETFDEFAAAHPELFVASPLARWYTDETLASSRARRSFVFPDRV
jgi:hypothetical protein